MRKPLRLLTVLALCTAPLAATVAFAPPASACTGAPCDAFCYSYAALPDTVKQKVFRSEYCPVL